MAVAGSFCCSLAEASLYAVPLAHVRHLAASGSRAGRILLDFKNNVERPVSAILILNTVANTAGASVSGWAFGHIFQESMGEAGFFVFSAVTIVAIVIFGEIMPKVAGVVYCRRVAAAVAMPVYAAVVVLAWPIKLSAAMAEFLKPKDEPPAVSEEEVLSMAALGTEEGTLDDFEGSVIENVIKLDDVLIKDILTPRVVVFRVDENLSLGEIEGEVTKWQYTRVPLFSEGDPDHLSAYVTQRDIYRELLRGSRDKRLKDLARPMRAVPELQRSDKLLSQMFELKERICSVVDEHGSLAGIITLEDIVEELVGREIVDEYDDFQAKSRAAERGPKVNRVMKRLFRGKKA